MKYPKRTILLLLLSFILIDGYCQTQFMSFNIRYDNPVDGENWWENRKYEVSDLIKFYHPEFIGLQEVLNNQLDFIDKELKEYSYIGFGRDGAGSISEAVPIFFDTAKFELINNQTFWLSATPLIQSKGWDAALNRISTYGAFNNKVTFDTIHVFNCHFDHIGATARANSSRVIIEMIKEYNLIDKKVVVMGDFNCETDEEPYILLNAFLDDGLKHSINKMYGPNGTWNGFEIDKIISRRIDYIFSKGVSVINYRHIDDKRKNNLQVSDHLPVIMEIK